MVLILQPTEALPLWMSPSAPYLSSRNATSDPQIAQGSTLDLQFPPRPASTFDNDFMVSNLMTPSRTRSKVQREIHTWQVVSREIAAWAALTASTPVRQQSRTPFMELSNDSLHSLDSTKSADLTPPHPLLESSIEKHEQAHKTALQLLSSSFTMAPASFPASYDGAAGPMTTPFPDPHLISSLRLHAYYYSSPAHGTQARAPSEIGQPHFKSDALYLPRGNVFTVPSLVSKYAIRSPSHTLRLSIPTGSYVSTTHPLHGSGSTDFERQRASSVYRPLSVVRPPTNLTLQPPPRKKAKPAKKWFWGFLPRAVIKKWKGGKDSETVSKKGGRLIRRSDGGERQVDDVWR
ncbi:MAG: hypothetical protein M1814_006868 [Vezdaea aestivalis]|nr:MAG: hypothetical protein M1814_006868 [Vezdaea aestivalis]